MERDNFSKATALFNFLMKNFDLQKRIGNLDLQEILKIVEFIEGEKFQKL